MKQISVTSSNVASARSDDKRGVMMVCVSALAFSTAGIFTKSVDAGAWDVIFWRGLGGIAFTLLYVLARAGIKDELRRFGAPAVLAAVLMASGTAAFIPAFKLTSVANVSLIWATSPFIGAILAWVFIKEAPSAKVLICSGLAVAGVVITLRGSLSTGTMIGDLLALWMTLMMAATMVLYRARPDTPTKLPAALSALLLLPFALSISDPSHVSGREIGILLVFGLVFALASVLLAEGARLIPSARAALISALETPLAPIWAMLILAEWPAVSTVIGGAIIMMAVIVSQGAARSPRIVGPADTQANQAALAGLKPQLRRDIGFDDAHVPVNSLGQDRLEIEIRRLRGRL